MDIKTVLNVVALGLLSFVFTAKGEYDMNKAARSVHLRYKAPDATIYYNEVVVEQSQKGSYFCVCGFNHGYFGIQEQMKDKVVIFSVWDPGKQNNPDSVEEEQRVKLLYQGDGVKVGRFGNEGTGGQSFLKYDWKVGQTYKFMVKAKVVKNRTEYQAYFYINEKQKWKHLVTFSTITNGEYLKGYYSFIEDFRRDFKSAKEMRRARFTNGWVKTVDGNWISLTQAQFSADGDQPKTFDAGPIENGFFLQTGGETVNKTKLWSWMKRLPLGLKIPNDQ